MQHIAAALVKAQRQFGPALKTHSNPAFKSKYADLAACIEAVIDALNANGIFLMQPSHGRLSVPATKQDAQGFGSALTYARRYSLMAACGIAPEDDDGQGAAAAKRKHDATPPAAAGATDTSPKAIARRLATGVSAGDAVGVCDYLIGLDDAERDAIWALLDVKTQGKLSAVWPKESA